MATDHGVRFTALVLPNAPITTLLDRCRHIEALGFDGVGVADHLMNYEGGTGPWFELWTLLSAFASVTRRIRIAPLVAQIPLRNPTLFAFEALTVDHISAGRLDLGLGAGVSGDRSHGMVGVEHWSGAERVARLDEYLEIVDRLMRSDEEVTFEGRYYRVKDAILRPRPVQSPRPPLIVAALGPVMLRLAARRADVWNSMSFADDFEEQLAETRQRLEAMDRCLALADRDPATLRRAYLMYPGDEGSSDSLAYYASTSAFERMVTQLLDLGIDEIGLFYPSGADQVDVFEQVARDVIPMLRRG